MAKQLQYIVWLKSGKMDANVDTHDKTWVLHLDSFLAILRMQAQTHDNTVFTTMKKSLRITDSGKAISAFEEEIYSVDTPPLHMEVTKLRLR